MNSRKMWWQNVILHVDIPAPAMVMMFLQFFSFMYLTTPSKLASLRTYIWKEILESLKTYTECEFRSSKLTIFGGGLVFEILASKPSPKVSAKNCLTDSIEPSSRDPSVSMSDGDAGKLPSSSSSKLSSWRLESTAKN